MSKFLIVGGSLAQLPLVLAAKARGMEAVVIDGNESCIAASIADEFIHSDFSKVSDSLSKVEGMNFSGIATCASDAGVPFIWSYKSTNGLCEPSVAHSVITMTNKRKFREWQNATEAPGKISILDLEKRNVETLNKVVFKQSFSSGSSGVKIVEREKINNIAGSNEFDFAEEYIDFEYEIGAQVAIDKEGGFIYFIHGDFVGGENQTVPLGHYYPSFVAQNVEERVASIIEHLISNLSLRQMWLNLDFGVLGDEVFLIEVGARLGATGLGRLSAEVFDISWPDMLLNLEISGSTPQKKRNVYALCRAVFPGRPGTYRVIDDDENLEVLRRVSTFTGAIGSGRDVMAILHRNYSSKEELRLVVKNHGFFIKDECFGRA